MKAERILARLNAFHSLLKYRVERIADARQPRTQELSLSLILTDVDAAIEEVKSLLAEPVRLVLYCPSCTAQHIDAPEAETSWTNPPHRTHLCHNCGALWRPANFATEGVDAEISGAQEGGTAR